MEMDILKACGLTILAKDAFGPTSGLPEHDLIMFKNSRQRRIWEQKAMARKGRLNRILELGVARGGSLPYIFEICDADFIVGVDIVENKPEIRKAYDRSTMKGKYALHFETDQNDANTLKAIAQEHFDGELDLIIDDASHLLGDTRNAFEALFPTLRPGGLYVIEDYSWSHNEQFSYVAHERYHNQPSTTQLAFELTMLMSTHHNWITKVVADYNTITIVKGPEKLPEPFSIKEHSVNWAPLEMRKLVKPAPKKT